MAASHPLVLFVHIPRTGGTTLWSVLNAAYPAGRVRRVIEGDLEDVQRAAVALMAEGAPDLNVLGGHFRYGIHGNSTREVAYMTQLRDPTDMLISRYYKILRKPNKTRHAEFTEQKVDLLEGIRRLDSNSQTSTLAGLSPEEAVLPEHLEQAKRNLESFAVVGLVERFDETLALMRQAFGWSRIPYYRLRNAGSNRPDDIPQEVYDLGRELNALDYALYEFASDLFNQRMAEGGAGLRGSVMLYRARRQVQGWFDSKAKDSADKE
jgi:hypothetical protein